MTREYIKTKKKIYTMKVFNNKSNKVIGKMVGKMDKVKFYWKMELIMKENWIEIWEMVKVKWNI